MGMESRGPCVFIFIAIKLRRKFVNKVELLGRRLRNAKQMFASMLHANGVTCLKQFLSLYTKDSPSYSHYH